MEKLLLELTCRSMQSRVETGLMLPFNTYPLHIRSSRYNTHSPPQIRSSNIAWLDMQPDIPCPFFAFVEAPADIGIVLGVGRSTFAVAEVELRRFAAGGDSRRPWDHNFAVGTAAAPDPDSTLGQTWETELRDLRPRGRKLWRTRG